MSNAQHSSQTNEHYTPLFVVEAARTFLGGIDLDPASSLKANTIVRAEHIYTVGDNGLEQPWHGNVFLNPPGGRGSAKRWWVKLMQQWTSGNIEAAVFIGFSIEILQTGQNISPCPTDFHLCFPRKRIAFLDTELKLQKSPTHANVIVGVSRGASFRAFENAFKGIGDCKA